MYGVSTHHYLHVAHVQLSGSGCFKRAPVSADINVGYRVQMCAMGGLEFLIGIRMIHLVMYAGTAQLSQNFILDRNVADK